MLWDVEQVEATFRTPELSEPSGDDCLIASVTRSPSSLVRALRFTGGLDRFTLCDGMAFPERFTSLEGTEYELVSHEVGTEPLRLPSGTGDAPAKKLPVQMRETPDPLTVSHPDVENEFPVEEAHQVGLDRSTAYRDVFENRSALLVGTDFTFPSRGGNDLIGTERKTLERTLTAVAPDDRAVKLKIEKQTNEQEIGPTGHDSTSYDVLDEDVGSWNGDSVNRSRIADEQASPRDSLRLLDELVDQPRSRGGYGLWSTVPERPLTADVTGPSLRGEGYVINVWYDPPTNELLRVPWQGVLDGPTGTVLWFDVDRDQLPFAGHP